MITIGWLSALFIDVGDAVVVRVSGLFLADGAVAAVPHPEQYSGEHRGCHRSGQDGDFDVVIGGGVATEGEFADEQGHGEADAAEYCDSREVGPGQAGLQRAASDL